MSSSGELTQRGKSLLAEYYLSGTHSQICQQFRPHFNIGAAEGLPRARSARPLPTPTFGATRHGGPAPDRGRRRETPGGDQAVLEEVKFSSLGGSVQLQRPSLESES